MADMPSVKIIHHSAYKGGTKTWSNRHHFSGGTPADLTAWTTFVGNIVTAEKLAMSSGVLYDEALCYAAGSDLPLHTISLSGTGSLSGATGEIIMPLEEAALIRWSTDQRTSKNHPIYLFSYMHAVINKAGSNTEAIKTSQVTALGTYASAWVSGFSDGTNTLKRAGPHGAVALGQFIDPNMTHRDFID